MEEKSEEEEKPKATASKKRAAPDSGFSETGKLLKYLTLYRLELCTKKPADLPVAKVPETY